MQGNVNVHVLERRLPSPRWTMKPIHTWNGVMCKVVETKVLIIFSLFAFTKKGFLSKKIVVRTFNPLSTADVKSTHSSISKSNASMFENGNISFLLLLVIQFVTRQLSSSCCFSSRTVTSTITSIMLPITSIFSVGHLPSRTNFRPCASHPNQRLTCYHEHFLPRTVFTFNRTSVINIYSL